jgi:aspartate--ammonia ligase
MERRMALGKYQIEPGKGIYTDMNAIRRVRIWIISIPFIVDQWDWEKAINKSDRNDRISERNSHYHL